MTEGTSREPQHPPLASGRERNGEAVPRRVGRIESRILAAVSGDRFHQRHGPGDTPDRLGR